MRGLVFTEFLDFVESRAGPEMVEVMIEAAAPKSGGAYTSVGTYDHGELLEMLAFLNTATGQEVAEMVRAFGRHLFSRLVAAHPGIVEDEARFLDFLAGIETHIHAEVRKLYPNAELPFFDVAGKDGGRLRLIYQSRRPFADLAHGMLEGAAEYFHQSISLKRRDRTTETGFETQFDVSLAA